jgi:hypothetical protein
MWMACTSPEVEATRNVFTAPLTGENWRKSTIQCVIKSSKGMPGVSTVYSDVPGL